MTTTEEHLGRIRHALDRDQLLEYRVREDLIRAILVVKEQKNVLFLGHNYMDPLIFNLSERYQRGDSLQLAQIASKTDNPIILVNGVRFMAETVKLLNPEKKVLIADITAGCSLADPCTPELILGYKLQYPKVPVVLYVNSSVAAKAEVDYCCTSSNCVAVVQKAAEEHNTNTILFLPDTYMGQNIEEELAGVGADINIVYPGKTDGKKITCMVHDRITVDLLRSIRQQYGIDKNNPATRILVHWECSPDVLAEADFHGSTTGIAKYIAQHKELEKVYIGTECEMTAHLQAEYPNIEFVKTCTFNCEHMKKINPFIIFVV